MAGGDEMRDGDGAERSFVERQLAACIRWMHSLVCDRNFVVRCPKSGVYGTGESERERRAAVASVSVQAGRERQTWSGNT